MFFSSCFEPVSFILVWKSYLIYSNQHAWPSRFHHWLKFSIMKARLAQWRQIFFSPYLSLRSMAVLPGALLRGERRSRKNARKRAASPRRFSALAPLYWFARSTKTTMLRWLVRRFSFFERHLDLEHFTHFIDNVWTFYFEHVILNFSVRVILFVLLT